MTDEKEPVCTICQKPMEKLECGYCGGNGYIKEFLIRKSECIICQGKGWVLRCPDEASHPKGIPNNVREIMQKTLAQLEKDGSTLFQGGEFRNLEGKSIFDKVNVKGIRQENSSWVTRNLFLENNERFRKGTSNMDGNDSQVPTPPGSIKINTNKLPSIFNDGKTVNTFNRANPNSLFNRNNPVNPYNPSRLRGSLPGDPPTLPPPPDLPDGKSSK